MCSHNFSARRVFNILFLFLLLFYINIILRLKQSFKKHSQSSMSKWQTMFINVNRILPHKVIVFLTGLLTPSIRRAPYPLHEISAYLLTMVTGPSVETLRASDTKLRRWDVFWELPVVFRKPVGSTIITVCFDSCGIEKVAVSCNKMLYP